MEENRKYNDTINELKGVKHDYEVRIEDLLREFTKETGLLVNGLRFDYFEIELINERNYDVVINAVL